MRRMSLLSAAVAVCFVTLPTSGSFAQYGSEEGVHGAGSVVLERPAERMRMEIDLLARSTKDLADALTRLKAQRAKAEKQLDTLGAVKGSAKFGDPHLNESEDDNQQQMRMQMMMQRMRQGGKKPPKKPAAKPVKVSLKLTAEWSLKSTDAAGLLLEASKIQDAIKAADLAGTKEAEEPTEEEAEEAEEMEDAAMQFGGRNTPKPGQPSFVFVALIPEADHKKALADAFRAAHAEAAGLAKAADQQLGALKSLQSNGSVDAGDDDSFQQRMYQSRFARLCASQMNGKSEIPEAIGPAPGILRYRVGVTATFSFNSAGNSK